MEDIMNFKSFEEIISYAIEKEREAAQFYDDMSRQEPYSGAKKLFEEFAGEEQKHQAMLEDLSSNREKLAEYKFEWIPDMKRSDYLVDIEYRKDMDYTDILRLAMKREEKSLELYNELVEKAEEEDLVTLFRMLSQEEAKHKLALETLYDDYMATLGD
jgi:rubrerythrin